MLDNVSMIWNTVKYMTPRQWRYRLYYATRDKLRKRVPQQLNYSIEPFLLPMHYSINVDNKEKNVADRILNNQLPSIAGTTKMIDGDWDFANEEYRLISFKINSFNWLIFLSDAYKLTADRNYINKGKELIKDWQDKCGKEIKGDKWNAYVVAERIVNWIGFFSEYPDKDIQECIAWIYSQAQELCASIEYQLGANHLLSEAKALVVAGAFLKDKKLYCTGKRLLMDEAVTQFLTDGGHYERSISYHVESMEQYFEAYAVMTVMDDTDAVSFVEILREPYRYLNGMIGVNGKIPLFNDSAVDYPFYDAADFLSTADLIFDKEAPNGRKATYYKRWSWLGHSRYKIKWSYPIIYNKSGYIHYKFNVKDKQYSFFMDVANCGPDENPGHAHADALSILLSSEDKDILVDSGVFTYKKGIERNACRATKAHNTVEIDGLNSAEIWSSFRVARRGYTKIREFSSNNGIRVIASHDGYTKCLKDPAEHIREVVVRDNYIQIYDYIETEGKHRALSRLHIGPECIVVQIDAFSCMIDDNIKVKSDHRIRIVDCEIATYFGQKRVSKCIEIDFGESSSIRANISLM